MKTALLMLVATLILTGCVTVTTKRPDPLSPEQVVQLAKEGKSADDIIALMKESRAVYRMSASKLAELRQQGVPDAVIDYMQSTYLEQVRREEAYRPIYPYYPYYWGPYPYWRHRHWGPHPYWYWY